MIKKQIKRSLRLRLKILATQSYTRGDLDPKKVESIARILKRSQLRQYLRAIKKLEESRKVVVVFSRFDDFKKEGLKKTFAKLYPDKKIVFEEDKSLIVGVKVINNDEIFEFNLNNTLDNLSSYIQETYD